MFYLIALAISTTLLNQKFPSSYIEAQLAKKGLANTNILCRDQCSCFGCFGPPGKSGEEGRQGLPVQETELDDEQVFSQPLITDLLTQMYTLRSAAFVKLGVYLCCISR